MCPSAAAPSPLADRRLALVVDRDDDTRQLYAEALARDAWRIEQAADGREALAKALADRPHVIVAETQLPGISGYDLCALLRRDPSTRSIPILIVTADAFPANIKRAQDAGADAVLIKPCLPDRLVDEARRLVAASVETGRDASGAGEARRRGQPPDAATRDAGTIEVATRRKALARAHHRHDTTMPPVAPAALVCPECDRPLTYQRSHIGGVSARHQEQWDYFECPAGCGTFQYRVRTRKLRKV